ncbi:hypothetical protein ACWEFJ_24230 [Actinosynnema sp. NPDC004786]
MDAQDGTTHTSALRTTLRRIVLVAFLCAAALIALLIGMGLVSVTGLSADPHGYGMFAAILFVAVLTPIALVLWLLYRFLQRDGKSLCGSIA